MFLYICINKNFLCYVAIGLNEKAQMASRIQQLNKRALSVSAASFKAFSDLFTCEAVLINV